MGRRVIKATPDALAGLEIQDEAAKLSGSNESFFYTDESGCYIVGPISIRSDPENIRIATGYTFQPAYKAQIPSTCVTPQPTLLSNSPISGFTSFVNEVTELIGELL